MNKSITSSPARRAQFTHAGLWWLLALLWMGLIFLFSAQSDFDFLTDAWQADPVSWAAHFAEYAILAALLWQALRRTGRFERHAARWAFLFTLLYAFSDELHQFFVPGRYSDIRDVLVDALGALTALWLLRRAGGRRKVAIDTL